jgi:hypothetical protein
MEINKPNICLTDIIVTHEFKDNSYHFIRNYCGLVESLLVRPFTGVEFDLYIENVHIASSKNGIINFQGYGVSRKTFHITNMEEYFPQISEYCLDFTVFDKVKIIFKDHVDNPSIIIKRYNVISDDGLFLFSY